MSRHRLSIEQLLTHEPGTAVADTIEYRMLDKNGADPESRVTLQQIEEASRKAKELANQLMSFSKGGLPVMTQHREYAFSGAFPKPFTRQPVDKMVAVIPQP
jgi:hypothetical protein